jgi:hypothetical protein
MGLVRHVAEAFELLRELPGLEVRTRQAFRRSRAHTRINDVGAGPRERPAPINEEA